MPSVYLSPSLQEYNPYIDGGNEEYYMNLIADAMEPYLRASGIDFRRNDPDMTLSQAIADSNKGNHDLHLAIHNNAAPEVRQADTRVQIFITIRQAVTASVSLKFCKRITKIFIPNRTMLT